MSGHINTGDVAGVTEQLPVFWLVSVQPVWAGDLTWNKIASAHGDHCTRMPKICVCRGWICVMRITSNLHSQERQNPLPLRRLLRPQ